MKILITGVAGFIGSNLVDSLIEENEIIGVDNFNDYYNPKIKERNISNIKDHKNFKLYRVDITDKVAIARVFKEHKPDKIIHLAARAGVRPSIKNPELYAKVNVLGTLNLLELSKNIKQFIFGSSSSVYGNQKEVPFFENDKIDKPISPYAATKISGEMLCYTYSKLYNIPTTCLRFFTVYGPRNRPDMAIFKFIDGINKNREIEIYDKKSKRDYTFVEDIVEGVKASLNNLFSYEIINLGNSLPISLKTIVSLIEKELDKKALIKFSHKQAGDVDITYANISKAKKLLGYNPKTSIEKGIKKTIKWYLNFHKKNETDISSNKKAS